MKKFNAHPHVPEWIEAMDGELLTSPQLDVLNFIHWCKKYGCRTSNDHIGAYTHRTHATVQRAIGKLYQMDLVAIENYGKRTRVIKPVQWPTREEWEKYKKMADHPMVDAAHSAPHITLRQDNPPLRGGLSKGGKLYRPAGDDILPGGCRPQTPARCSVGKVDIPFTPQGEKPPPTYQEAAIEMRDKLVEVGWTKEQAERKTRRRYPQAKFEN